MSRVSDGAFATVVAQVGTDDRMCFAVLPPIPARPGNDAGRASRSGSGYWVLEAVWPAAGPEPDSGPRVARACDRSTPVGRRDFAVITIFARLGLRSGEVSVLRLEDVDCVSGTVAVHGKGNRIDKLPLPVDVGRALVDYLREGRPAGIPARTVFVRAKAPFTPLVPAVSAASLRGPPNGRGWARSTPTGCVTPPRPGL